MIKEPMVGLQNRNFDNIINDLKQNINANKEKTIDQSSNILDLDLKLVE